MKRLAILVMALASASASASASPTDGLEAAATKVTASVVRLADYVSGEEVGHGSGFFVADGVVVTNHHVIEHVRGSMVAIFADGKKAKVLGMLADDETHDLALLRIDGSAPPLVLAPGAELHVGQRAIAIGSPLGFDQTVSAGIVSAVRDGFPPNS